MDERHSYEMNIRNLLVVLGTPVDALTMDEALSRIDDFIAVGRATGKGHQIATVNADFVVKSLRDPQLRHILRCADMATADGIALVWGARLLGVPIRGRVTGVDMVSAMAKRAADAGHSVYFLGAAPGVAQQAAERLQRIYPSLKIAGVDSPSRQAVGAGDPSIVRACKEADPDILLVAFGNPKQEKWIYSHAQELAIPVMMGVGGTFDFIAGITKRAPEWIQTLGLEWLYRLVREPRRLWKRYAIDLIGFSVFFLRQWWSMRQARRPAKIRAASSLHDIQGTPVLSVQGRLDTTNKAEFALLASERLASTPFLILDLSGAEFLDSAAIGTLVALTKLSRDAGGNLWLAAVPSSIMHVFSMLKLDQFLDIATNVENALELCRTYENEGVSA